MTQLNMIKRFESLLAIVLHGDDMKSFSERFNKAVQHSPFHWRDYSRHFTMGILDVYLLHRIMKHWTQCLLFEGTDVREFPLLEVVPKEF